MQLGEYSYEKPELVLIAEKIYECKANKKNVQYNLDEEEHHYNNIMKSQSMSFAATFWLTFIAILLTVLDFVCLVAWMKRMDVMSNNPGHKIMIFTMGLLYIILTVLSLIFWIHAIRNLHEFMDMKKIVDGDKHNFHAEQKKSFQKIEDLKAQIEAIDQEINALLKRQEAQEKLLGEKVNLTDSGQGKSKTNAKFSIRAESMGEAEALEVIECYDMEIKFYKNEIQRINKEIGHIDRSIISVDEKYELAKKKMILFAGIFFIYAILQNLSTGELYTMLSVVGLIGSTIGIIYIEEASREPIINYLVEHEHKLVKDYVFRNNIISFGNRRKEMLEEIEQCTTEIQQIEYRKQIVESYIR